MTCGEITARMAIPVLPQSGGTGVRNNPASTLTISGKFPTTLTVTGTTNVTLPTSGTLVNTAVTTLSSLVSVSTITTGNWNAAGFIRVNGASSLGIDCLANDKTANIGATCTSNTSGHHARLYAEMDGNNSGQDPFINFKNSNASTDWAVGSDTSDSGKFKVSAGATLGTTDVMTIDASGNVAILAGTLALSGAVTNHITINSATGASNTADLILNRFDLANGFTRIQYKTAGSLKWGVGSRSGSDNLLIYDETNAVAIATFTQGSGISSKLALASIVNNSGQPVFNAWKTGSASNITGDGTVSGVLIDAQNQQNSCYSGNQTYTANQTGYHLLTCSFGFTNLSTSFTHGDIRITTTSETYILFACNVGAVRDASNNATFTSAVIAKMTAGDTAISQFMASGGTKVVGVAGSATAITSFSGIQLC